MMRKKGFLLSFCFVLLSCFLFAETSLVIYSGRSEKLVGQVLKNFEKKTGISLKVRYGKTPQLAALLAEEGSRSPADVFFAQDAGALGSLAQMGLFAPIDSSLLSDLDSKYMSPDFLWTGVTGRARTVDYNTDKVSPSSLPLSIWGFLDQRWSGGKIGWAPTNSSFQSFVAGMLVTQGEARTRMWLRGIQNNKPRVYPKNSSIVAALGRGEVEVGFVNNYYLQRFLKQNPKFPVAHHHTKGDVGSMINVAGVGLLRSSPKKKLAERLFRFLLSSDVQKYFAENTFEYPLRKGIPVYGPQKNLKKLPAPDLDLGDLKIVRKAVEILKQEKIL